MKKSVRRLGIIVASPLVLFVIVCVLVYLPPIQNFLVNTATRYASEATGMQISIGRISLSFPLDLVVRRTLVDQFNQTLATLPAYATAENRADLAVETARACTQLQQIRQSFFSRF